MLKTGGYKRLARALGVGVLVGGVTLGMGSFASTSSATVDPTPTASATPDQKASGFKSAAVAGGPYGSAFPVFVESNFSRPRKSISSSSNSDFTLLNDLERLIRGSYLNPNTGRLRPLAERKGNMVRLSISRMENSHRVGRELLKAAKYGVRTYVIHGKASQSKESRALQSKLNRYKAGHFHICQKGRSLACLGGLNGAIMHSKILIISSTYTKDKKKALGVIWSGSANLGGPSGEKTWNNGWTVYNDRKLYFQTAQMWRDMWAERNIGNNYPKYVRLHASRYGYRGATAHGYTSDYAYNGMFYSNLSNVTIYGTPIYATPSNGADPVINVLNRILPDDTCRIRVQHNRFKYRRIAVANKLVELADRGCRVEAIAYQDDLKVNRKAHCQSYIRICTPILDVFRTARVRIPAAYAKPHDKTMLIEAKMRPNSWSREERLPEGGVWPASGAQVKLVQAGSAALTGSNLVVSDEITTETTNPEIYNDYREHWNAIWKSYEKRDYKY